MRSKNAFRNSILMAACCLAAIAATAIVIPSRKASPPEAATVPNPVAVAAPMPSQDRPEITSSGDQLFVDDFGYGHVVGPDKAVCFAPGTSKEYMEQVSAMLYGQNGPQPRFNIGPRWAAGLNGGDGQNGSPQILRWSFVPDGTPNVTDANGANPTGSSLFSVMDSAFAAQGGRATWIARIQACFDRWQALSGLSYERVILANDADDGSSFHSTPGTAGLRGDVRIAMRVIDGQNGILAFNNFPQDGDMTLDAADANNNFAAANNNHVFLRNVVTHEHGHGLGFFHVCPANATKLMEPFISTQYDGPQQDDIRAAHTFYGDKYEPNDSIAQSTNLNAIAPLGLGTPFTLGPTPAPTVANGSILSMEPADNATGDYFKFTIPQALAATITVNPVGSSYDSSTQNGDGSCGSGNVINSLNIANLNFQVFATNGTTLLATANSAPAGAPETLANIQLLGPGTYYLRIFSATALGANQTQLYNFSLTFTDLDCNHNGIPDPTDIANQTSLDCNSDGVPDECQVPPLCTNQLCPDCNNDGIPDNCQVPPICTGPGCPDCNGNGIPDSCEPDCNTNGRPDSCDISLGSSQDCQPDAIPDECQVPPICTAGGCPDCNHNLVPDLCEFISGTLTDCNNDSIADRCQTDPALCGGAGPACIADCDHNFVPDVCQTIGAFSQQSPNLSPLIQPITQTYTLVAPPPASGDVALFFKAVGDIDAASEIVSIDINGTPVGDAFAFSGFTCPSFNTDTLIVPAATWNAAVAGGNAAINMVPNPLVDGACGGTSYISVKIDYAAAQGDCNANGQLDACEIAAGTATDCNANGKPDDCDIAEGFLTDGDQDGRPDECGCNAFCQGDLDLDDTVDGRDIPAFLACLQSGNLAANDCGCADMNGDLRLDNTDKSLFVTKLLSDPSTLCP